MSAGQVTARAPAATTVTLKEQVAWLPEASVAVQLTVVVPIGKVEPEGGLQATFTVPQLSVAAGMG
jgi:hypothetical protein